MTLLHDLPAAAPSAPSARAAVGLGGGHGLFATLRSLTHLTDDVTAVVTVADDGGSSGRLRRDFDVLPPGDLRMALAALSARTAQGELWEQVVQHRFGGSGALAGHATGNLLFVALTEVLGSSVAALDELGALLGVTGRVLPVSPIPLDIEAEVMGLEDDPRVMRPVRGQVAVATTPGRVRRVALVPNAPAACPEALAALEAADLITMGPGSWFSSVIPTVLVPEVLAAVRRSAATKVLVLNLEPQAGETDSFTAELHIHVLAQHAPGLRVDVILVDEGMQLSPRERRELDRAAERMGARVVMRPLAEEEQGHRVARHNPCLLAAALADICAADA